MTRRRKSAKVATLEPISARAATKASGPTSEGSPEVGSGLTVAVALGLGVAVAVGVVAVLRTLSTLKLQVFSPLSLEASGAATSNV
jgi:hypothetical protein